MSSSTFRLQVKLARKLVLPGGRVLGRDEFYTWSWDALASHGILGVHEGTLLSDEAAAQGFETDSWTLDAAEAPRERDWISSQDQATAEFYFASEKGALQAVEILGNIQGLQTGRIEEQKAEDWDAQWKASFLSTPGGVEVPPIWRIIPPWVLNMDLPAPKKDEVILRINPGAGFGTGTHETTQLCLAAIAESSRLPAFSLQGKSVLDFGSGSGILAIGAALLGARVDAVEIDPLAIDNAMENARLNQMEGSISYSQYFPEGEAGTPGRYRMVIANILRPVLLEFSEKLVQRMDTCSVLILSGLIQKDVEEVAARFGGLLGFAPECRALGEWHCLVWRRF